MSSLQILTDWIPASPTGYIILGILAVLVIYLAYWLVYASVALTFWLTSEILRGTFFSLTIMHYTLWVVFVSAPIRLLFRDQSMGSISTNYGNNVKMCFYIFYPKVNEKKSSESRPAIERATRTEEMAAKTEISKYSSISKTKKISTQSKTKPAQEFFCSVCGEPFSTSMKRTLSIKGYTYCEGCGKRFEKVNGSPAPVH